MKSNKERFVHSGLETVQYFREARQWEEKSKSVVVVDIVLALAKELNDRCIGRSMVRPVGITERDSRNEKERGSCPHVEFGKSIGGCPRY